MGTIKERVAKVWNNHKAEIIMVGVAVVGGLGIACYGRSKFVKGYKRGALNGFYTTLNWLDEEFPTMEATKTVMEYKEANPDKWVTVYW